MKFHELASPEDTRAYVLLGLTHMRVARWQPAIVRPALEWIMALASEGHPLPPAGFVADLGVIASGMEGRLRSDAAVASKWPMNMTRAYEDHVIGKLYSDRSLDRAGDALRRIADKDRALALAYIVERVRDRLGIGGVMVGTAPLKTLMEMSPETVVAAAWQVEPTDLVQELLLSRYQELIAGVRLAADLLGPEDVFELERGTAVAQLGQRLALRQIIQAAAAFAKDLPTIPPTRPTRPETPTRMRDDEAYPVGGFASIANRGTMESLLHSQLAYMEIDEAERPDLFDVKFLRDELLYYSRDENQFYRRRRHYVFAFDADLVSARIKDPDIPYQRIVMALAAVVAMVQCLTTWLSDEALTIELLFPNNAALDAEQKLLSTVFQEAIAGGTVIVATYSPDQNWTDVEIARSRRGECRLIRLTTSDKVVNVGGTLRVTPTPALRTSTQPSAGQPQDWSDVVTQLATELVA